MSSPGGSALGMCLLREVYALGGVSAAPGGVCSGGVSAPRGVSAALGDVCSQGGVCSRGVSAPGGGVCIPPHTEADNLPCGQTDACKNITFATSLRTVIISFTRKLDLAVRCSSRNSPW